MRLTSSLAFSGAVLMLLSGCTGASYEMANHKERTDEFMKNQNQNNVLVGKVDENRKVADAITIYPNEKLSSALKDLGVLEDRYYILQGGKDFEIVGTRPFKIHSFEELNEYIKTVSNYEIDVTKNKFVRNMPKIVEAKEQKVTTILDQIHVTLNKALTPSQVFYENSSVMGWHMIDEAEIKQKFDEKQTINFDGTMRAFLEYFARNNDVYVDIDPTRKEIAFKKYKTKHFPLQITTENIAFNNDIATNIEEQGSTNSRSGGSSSTQNGQNGKITIKNTYDVLASIKALLDKVIATKDTNEYWQFFDATNELVVKTTPSKMETIEKTVANINSTALKQISLKVSIYEVTLDKRYQHGIDWGYVNTKATSATNSIVTAINSASMTPTVDSALSSPTVFKYVGTEGLNVAVKAMNEFGDTQLMDQTTVLATNNIPTIINKINRQAYISSYSNTSTASVGSTATVEQSNAIGGKYVYLKPSIFNDKTFMSLKIIRAKVNKIEKQEFSADQYVQTPNDDRDIISQNFTIQDGEKIVIGGFIQRSDGKGYNGILPNGDNVFSSLAGVNDKSFMNKEVVLVIEAKEL